MGWRREDCQQTALSRGANCFLAFNGNVLKWACKPAVSRVLKHLGDFSCSSLASMTAPLCVLIYLPFTIGDWAVHLISIPIKYSPIFLQPTQLNTQENKPVSTFAGSISHSWWKTYHQVCSSSWKEEVELIIWFTILQLFIILLEYNIRYNQHQILIDRTVTNTWQKPSLD